MDMTADLLGIADVSRRALSHIYRLFTSWSSAPDQLRQLENDVARLSNLLDTVREAGRFHDRLGKTAAARALNQEVILAGDSVKSIQETLREIVGDGDWMGAILPGPPGGTRPSGSDTPRRLRWMARKEDLAMAQRSLRLSCQQILSRLIILNLEVSTETLSSTKWHETASFERYEHIDTKIDGISSQIHHLALSTMQTNEPLSGQTARSSFAVVSRHSIAQNRPEQTELRDSHNESRFQHLEELFANATSPLITTPQSPAGGLGLNMMTPPSKLALKPGCACRCRCHRYLTKSRGLRLSTFRAALGSLSFGFSPRLSSSNITCNVKSCRRTREKWLRITYTLPAWLFHATITSVISNTTGPVEFVLRVCRRISPDMAVLGTSIFGYTGRRNVEQVKLMLQAKEGSVTDIKGDIGRGVLHLALLKKDFDMVKLLCQEGADWFQEQDDGLAPYQYALRLLFADPRMSGVDRQVLQSLMPFDIAIDRAELSDLHMVVMQIICLDLGQILQVRSCPVNVCDSLGNTPLYYAVAMGDVATVRALLEAGAEPDFCGSRKLAERPLHIACRYSRFGIVKMLVAAGANVDVLDSFEKTPLMLLSTRRSEDSAVGRRRQVEVDIRIAEYLVQSGANVLAEDAHRDTVLDHFATRDLAEVGEYLLTHHPEVPLEHRDWEGTTPLGNAVAFCSLNMIEMLLRNGSDPKYVDRNGLTILHYIAAYGDLDTMRLFVHLAETGVISGIGLDPAAVSDANATPLGALDARLDVDEHMREAFRRLLDLVASPCPDANGEYEPDGKTTETAEQDEFYDASEYIV